MSTMKTNKQHFEDLKRFRPMFVALANFMDDKDTIASHENAYNEAENRLKDKRWEEATIDARLAQVAETEKEILARNEQSKLDQEAHTEKLNLELEQQASAARAMGDEIIQATRANAEKHTKEVNDELLQIKHLIQGKLKAMNELDDLIAQRKEEHAGLQDKIIQAKETISKILAH